MIAVILIYLLYFDWLILNSLHGTGKTNHGQKLYGRATRHSKVTLCSVGALAFYLALRFDLSHEFDEFTVEDWMSNQAWFDIKLLVGDASRSGDRSFKRPMANGTYADAVKSVLGGLGIASKHWLHLGRGMGPKLLEISETQREEIRCLGNWDPKIQETTYSSKLPMRAIRNMAGYVMADGMYFNKRTTVEVPMELIRKTPFAFCLGVLDQLREMVNRGHKCYTALLFMEVMLEMAKILVQDAAALLIQSESRRRHPVFNLEVFRGNDFNEVSILGGLLLRLFFLSNIYALITM